MVIPRPRFLWVCKKKARYQTYLGFIQKYCEIDRLFSENARVKTIKAVQDIYCLYGIADLKCEPHMQQRKTDKRHIQEVKYNQHDNGPSWHTIEFVALVHNLLCLSTYSFGHWCFR